MTSQHPNPPADSKPLPREFPLCYAPTPFSLRKYVDVVREKYNATKYWPFSEKYLKMVMERGVSPKDVLSSKITLPTSSHHHDESLIIKGSSSNSSNFVVHPTNHNREETAMLANNDEEENQQNKNNNVVVNPPLKNFDNKKRKRKRMRSGRGGRHHQIKKRSMVDILAEAPHCSTQDQQEMYKTDKSIYLCRNCE